MSRFYRCLSIVLISFTFLAINTHAQNSKKKLVQVKQNADGTTTELEQVDPKTIVRRTLTEKKNGERIVASKTIYTKDRAGLLRNAKIYDGKNKQLFKILYGYHKQTGKLIMEDLFDAQGVRRNEAGQEMPLQRLHYKYDAFGNRSKPYAFTTTNKGKVEDYTIWKKHFKERNDKHKLNFDDEQGTSLTDKEIEALKEINQ